ncbi:compound eye opsin BCRH2-like [Antedon mediterranea]|uniref:compound eye opsin BCRH2-like n=1 Tax=Antedon mediterranea TaxID=105859 RepID=UPI003AF79F76
MAIYSYISLVIGVVAVLANGGSLYVFKRMKMISKTVTHSLLFHQSVIDCLSALLFLPFYPLSELFGIWQDNDAFCKCRGVYWILAVTSTANMIYLSIERYYAIVRPMRHLILFKGRALPVALPVTYLAGFICSVHAFIVSESDPVQKVCVYNWNGNDTLKLGHGVFIFIIEWIIPTTIFIYVHSKIYLTLKAHARSESATMSMPNTSTENVNNALNKCLVSIVLVIFVTYLVCWTPKIFLYLLENCGVKINSYLNQFSVLLLTSNLCWNPFIYTFKYKEFNQGVTRIWNEVIRRKPKMKSYVSHVYGNKTQVISVSEE